MWRLLLHFKARFWICDGFKEDIKFLHMAPLELLKCAACFFAVLDYHLDSKGRIKRTFKCKVIRWSDLWFEKNYSSKNSWTFFEEGRSFGVSHAFSLSLHFSPFALLRILILKFAYMVQTFSSVMFFAALIILQYESKKIDSRVKK